MTSNLLYEHHQQRNQEHRTKQVMCLLAGRCRQAETFRSEDGYQHKAAVQQDQPGQREQPEQADGKPVRGTFKHGKALDLSARGPALYT